MDKPEIDFPDFDPPADLVVTEIVEGDGPEASAGSTVSVHYVGVAHGTSSVCVTGSGITTPPGPAHPHWSAS